MTRHFSKDQKTHLLSLEDFLETYGYDPIPKKLMWDGVTAPREDTTYFKITGDKFIAIVYGLTTINFGMDFKEKLESIDVAYRDGVTEYKIFDEAIENLKIERAKHKKSKRLDEAIKAVTKRKKQMPPYQKSVACHSSDTFDDYLVDTGYKTDTSCYKRKYIVFDVETNGTRTQNDDLLSLSIYDPSTGMCYNRLLPLDLQPLVLTGFIHGISDEMLSNTPHLTQDEVDKIVEYFDLNNSVLLSFSGGKGTFDSSFVINYCSRHNITGFENLIYKNIKSYVPPAPFGSEGQLSKDNLCRLFGIDGVSDIHSSLNDCVLEWKLFEKLVRQPVFFIQQDLYRYSKDYIIPVTYLTKHPELVRLSGIKIPPVLGYVEKVFEYRFPEQALNEIRKFPTNITGITLENAIDSMLNVKEEDNYDFLVQNKKHLKYIGTLGTRIEQIPVITEDDGTIRTVDPKYEKYVNEINAVTKKIMEQLQPTIDFIKTSIFKTSEIKSQEMVISDDKKVLALCDLSSEDSVLEIKTMEIMQNDQYGEHILPYISRQLYYQSRGRNVYAASIVFDNHFDVINGNADYYVDSITISIYKVDLKVVEIKPEIYKPSFSTTTVLKELLTDNSQSYRQIASKTGFSERMVQDKVRELKEHGYLVREGMSNKYGVWRVLKDENGNLVPEEKQAKFRPIDNIQKYKDKVFNATNKTIKCTNYVNSSMRAEYECLNCGYKWNADPQRFFNRQGHKCPKCKAGIENKKQ